jgi:hypothetical protein
MAKLVKSTEEQNTWTVLDNNCTICGSVVDGKLVNVHRPTNDAEMPPLGIVCFDGGGFMFRPEIDNGVEHTADHLREIADLMDALEKTETASPEAPQHVYRAGQ